MKQEQLFGNPVEISETGKKIGKSTIKQKFRLITGYDNSNLCGNCDHCVKHNHNKRNYYKCEIMGKSHSEATDIRL